MRITWGGLVTLNWSIGSVQTAQRRLEVDRVLRCPVSQSCKHYEQLSLESARSACMTGKPNIRVVIDRAAPCIVSNRLCSGARIESSIREAAL